MAKSLIKPDVLKEFQRQLNQELGAAHAYLAMAAWCDDQNLKGFARYFSKQSVEEREHAEKIMKHLLDRQALPKLAAIAEPRSDFRTVEEIANHALSMEQTNSAGIRTCYEVALRENDFAAHALMQWFVTEQVEEEAWAVEMVERVEAASCAGAIGDLDRHIERYLEEKGLGGAGKD